MKNKNVDAIIVAAGKSERMGLKVKKQYIEINGLPLICYALKTFNKCEDIHTIYLVVPEMEIKMCQLHFVKPLNLSKRVHVVSGGSTRQGSVMNALKIINKRNNNNAYVLIHDAARPFVTENLVLECIKGVKKTGACVPIVPAIDSIKKIIYFKDKSYILKSVERKNIWFAQTPQVFDFKLIFEAYLEVSGNNINYTDDSAIIETTETPINIIQGLSYNIKVTTSEDLVLAEAIVKIMQK